MCEGYVLENRRFGLIIVGFPARVRFCASLFLVSYLDGIPRISVAGVGAFGRNHLRVVHQSGHAALAGVFDSSLERAEEAAAAYSCRVFHSLEELAANSDAAVVPTPTISHSSIGFRLLELGLDDLVENPIAR